MKMRSPELWLISVLTVATLTIMPWSIEWYRPLYAQYGGDLLESSRSAEEELEDAVQERLEEVRKTRSWGLFINYGYSDVERDETKRQSGYESDINRITLGADYRLGEFILGGAASYSREDQDGDSDVQLDDYTVVAYGSYYPVDSDLFVDGFLNYGLQEYDLVREDFLDTDNTVYRLRAEPDGYRVGTGLNLGYSWRRGPYNLTSVAELEYSYTHRSGYEESGPDALAAKFGSRSSESLTLGGSLIFSRALSTEWAIIVPQVRASYVHEFMSDAEDIDGEIDGERFSVRTDNPDRNYFFGSVGVSAITPDGLQFFADYEQRFGHRYLDTYMFTLGLRYEF